MRFVAAWALTLLSSCSLFDAPVVKVDQVEQMIRDADQNRDGSLSGFEIYALVVKLREASQ